MKSTTRRQNIAFDWVLLFITTLVFSHSSSPTVKFKQLPVGLKCLLNFPVYRFKKEYCGFVSLEEFIFPSMNFQKVKQKY